FFINLPVSPGRKNSERKSIFYGCRNLNFFFSIVILFMQLNANTQVKNVSSSFLITPELEKQVYASLRKTNLQFQIVENKGQGGLPADVVAYISSGKQFIFIEKD